MRQSAIINPEVSQNAKLYWEFGAGVQTRGSLTAWKTGGLHSCGLLPAFSASHVAIIAYIVKTQIMNIVFYSYSNASKRGSKQAKA